MEKHLAVDLGSGSGKILMGELTDDNKVAIKEIRRFDTPRTWYNGHLRTDIYGVLDEIGAAIKKLGAENVPIGSLAADSWSSDFGLVDQEGDLAGLPVFYRDRYTLGMPEEVEKIISYRELYKYSTQRRMRDSSLCQLLARKKENPASLKDKKMLFLADILMYFFSGKPVSEITLASYSQLFSMANKRWEDGVFDMFGLPKTLKPVIVNPCDHLGTLSAEAANWYGTNRFELVSAAGHDTSCAVAAVPAQAGGDWAFISTGSWFLVGMELDKPLNLDACYKYNFSNTGLAFGKTMLKRNVTAMWIIQECMRAWKKTNPNLTYQEIQARAQNAKPFFAMLDVDHADFYNPDDMPKAISEYLKKTRQPEVDPGDIGQIARLADESIAFKSAYAINCLRKITGKTPETVYAVGGASVIEFLNGMLADCINLPVAAGPTEATAIGNCLLQALGMGEISSEEELRQIVRNTQPVRLFMPGDTKPWRERYDAFVDFCGLQK